MLNRLITIPISHYCEKARWALQRVGLPFLEEAHPPVFHMASAWRAGGKRTVPVLVSADGVYNDSTDILQYLDRKAPEAGLYPNEPQARQEAEQLEELFDTVLGPHSRRWVYFHVLDRTDLLPYLCHGVGAREAALFRTLLPAARLVMRKALKITPEAAERSRVRVQEVFEQVGARLADGRRYLVGDRFGAADLTFAALAAPAILPPEYGSPLAPLEEMPQVMHEQIRAWRASPAGSFALRLYREDRK